MIRKIKDMTDSWIDDLKVINTWNEKRAVKEEELQVPNYIRNYAIVFIKNPKSSEGVTNKADVLSLNQFNDKREMNQKEIQAFVERVKQYYADFEFGMRKEDVPKGYFKIVFRYH